MITELIPQNYMLRGSEMFVRRESKKELIDKICVIILGRVVHCLSCTPNLEYVLPFHKIILLNHRCKLDEN